MDYMTANQAAKAWGISQRRVVGSFKLGETWAIPKETKKPLDKRKKAVISDDI